MSPLDNTSQSPSVHNKSTMAIPSYNMPSTSSYISYFSTVSSAVTPSLVQLPSIDSSTFLLSSSLAIHPNPPDLRHSDVSLIHPSPHDRFSMIPGSQNILITTTSSNSYTITKTVTQSTYTEETIPTDVNNGSTIIIIIAVTTIIIVLSLLIAIIGFFWYRIKIVTLRSNVTAHNVGKTVFALASYAEC